MVRLGKLDQRLWVRDEKQTIEDRKNESFIKVLSSKRTGKAGPSWSHIFYDEICDWPDSGRDVWNQLQGSTKARRNVLHVIASTAQFRLDTLGREQYELAVKIKKDPSINPRYHSCIYEVPNETGKEWEDPAEWWKANPSIGHCIWEQSFIDEFQTTKANPKAEYTFRVLALNQWMSGSSKWLATDVWNRCRATFNEDELVGYPTYFGCDFARKHDLCCYSIIVDKDEKLYVLTRTFLPSEDIERKERQDGVGYRHWASNPANHLYLNPGPVVNMAELRARLLEDAAKFSPIDIGFDPSYSEETRQILRDVEGLPLTELPQRLEFMSPAIAYMERNILEGKLQWQCPILDWCVCNAQFKVCKDDMGILVKENENKRIDLAVSTAIALHRHLCDPNKYMGRICF